MLFLLASWVLLPTVLQLTTPVAPPADFGRKLMTTGVVQATPEQVWAAFTTDVGLISWMVPVAHIDLRIGGTLETSYDANAKIGDPQNIHHRILAFEPNHIFAATFDMPAMWPKAHAEGGHWWVLRIEPIAPGWTRVTESILGFGQGEDWDKAYRGFEKGDADTMKKLQQHFAPKDAEQRAEVQKGAIAEKLKKFVGGVWTHTDEASGFRAKFVFEDPQKSAVFPAKGWLGDKNTLSFHGMSVASFDVRAGRWRADSWFEDGARVEFVLRSEGDKLFYDGTMTDASGAESTLRQIFTFEDADHVANEIWQSAPMSDEMKKIVGVRYGRVASDPELDALVHRPSGSR